MLQTLLPAGLLLLCGVIWRIVEPGGIATMQMRQQLNLLNINLLIPGMILSVMLRSSISSETWLLPVTAWLVIAICLLVNTITYRYLLKSAPDPSTGAMILAGSFGNRVGLAAPVVIAVYGLDAASFNAGVVLSDRYDLDVELYGVAVAVTAVLYFCLLPIWTWLAG